ncbi:MAG: HEAT repeat domain-containing protein [Planctomycetes bacterium]|nr:HEAT repeat domain-containing protein [Planctomycetota bacterium]
METSAKTPDRRRRLKPSRIRSILAAAARGESISRLIRLAGIHSVIRVWGERGGANSVPGLLKGLADSDRFVQNAAAEAFCGFSSSKAIVPLGRLLKDRWMVARCSAAEALGASGSRRAISHLRKALHDSNEVVRSYVVTSLGRLGDRSSIPDLENLNRTGSERERLSSAVALYLLGDRWRLEEVASFLKSGDYQIQCAAGNDLVWMLRRKDATRAIQLLRKAIREEPNRVRRKDFQVDLRNLRKIQAYR